MTAIVAWTDGKKNYLATDGRSMCGSTITSESFDKIVPIGNYYIAMSGLPRAQQLIRLAAERGIDEFPDSHLEIGEWIKALLDAEKWITDESDGVRVYQKFNGILVGPSGVYDIDPAFCLIESDVGRIAFRGSGGCDMAAALYALWSVGDRSSPDEQARIALECASRVDTGCGGILRFVSVDCAP